jgi:hypothetical protein
MHAHCPTQYPSYFSKQVGSGKKGASPNVGEAIANNRQSFKKFSVIF